MKKKLLFVGALSLLLMACGGSKAEETKTVKAEEPKLEGHLISKDLVELDIHMHFRNKYHYDENWPVAKEATKLTNVKLNNTASTTGTNSNEIFNIMMVSGKLPDVVGGNSRMNDFIRYGMEGAFVPLNEMIEEHAPNIKKFLNDNPKIKAAITAPDGNLYFIPYVQDGRVSRGYWIREDWLQKVGMETPNSIDEFYAAMKAFREQDPNGNGRKDETPMIFRHWYEMIRMTTLWGARTAGTDTFVSFYRDADGKVSHGWAEEEFKTGMKNLVKWYNEGLIDPEVFTRGKKTREVLFTADQGGMTHDWMASTSKFNEALKDKVPGFDLQPMLPPVNVNGERVEENQRALLKPDGWAITFENKKQVETIKYFDFFFSEEGRRLANFGVEGVHYDMIDGKPQFKEEILTADKAVNKQMWDIGAQVPIGFKMDYEYERQWTNPIAQKGVDMYSSGEVKYFDEFFPPALDTEERKIYDSKWPSIQTYMEESVQKWMLQNEDVDKVWDDYVNNLNEMGLKEVTAVMQSASDRTFKK